MAIFTTLLHGQTTKGFDVTPSFSISGTQILALLGYVAAACLTAFVFPALAGFVRGPAFPYVNKDRWELGDTKAREKFVSSARELLLTGWEKFKGPFFIVTDSGTKLILSPDYIDSVNNEPRLSFAKAIIKDMIGDVNGFEAVVLPPNHMIEEAIRTKLTQNLPKFTQSLSDEMSLCLNEKWGNETAWKPIQLKSDIQNTVSRLSALVFVGPELAHNPEWQKLSVEYTISVFTGQNDVKRFPYALRHIVAPFVPLARAARAQKARAREILTPILQKREAEQDAARLEGKPAPKYNDAIEWVRQTSKGDAYDPVQSQLSFTIAAIHTTSDIVTQVLLNVCQHPEIIPALREEAASVLKDGWSKIALYELKLLDSVMKETQRLKPPAMIFMSRLAVSDCTVHGDSGPITIRKGESLTFSNGRMWDDSVYENPDVFDPYRFLKRRDVPGLEHKSHFVSTSPEHTGFSHGKHACPGRFFASNETKIILVHILMKYDIRLQEGTRTEVDMYGAMMNSSATAVIEMRRRSEEVQL